MMEANKPGTPKLKLAVSWETDGGFFYKLSFHPGPYCQTGGDFYSPLPLNPQAYPLWQQLPPQPLSRTGREGRAVSHAHLHCSMLMFLY